MNTHAGNKHAGTEWNALLNRCTAARDCEPQEAERRLLRLYTQFPYLKYRTMAVLYSEYEGAGARTEPCATKQHLAGALVVRCTDSPELLMHLESLLQTYQFAIENMENGTYRDARW